MAGALGEKEPVSVEGGEGRRDRRSARVIDFATRSVREPEVSVPKADRLGLIAGLVVVVILLGLTYWTVRGSLQRPDRIYNSGVSQQQPESMIRIPITQPGDGPLVDVEAPVIAEDGTVAPLPTPDLAPVLADPPSSPGNTAPLFAEPEAQAAVKAPPKPTVVYESGGGNSSVKFAFEGGSDGKFARAIEAETPKQAATASAKSRALASSVAVGTTLGRGTVVPAVLETAIDTDVPGGVRAVVTNSILSSDGKTALVPKSSRMIGKYRTRESKGQRSAFVVWTQIVQPDGTRLDIGPKSTGSNDKNFFEDFASAQLVSVISGQTGPAFRARQGEPVRIMAARDLDLSKSR